MKTKIKYIILGEFSSGDTSLVDFLLEETENMDGDNTVLINKISTLVSDLSKDYNIDTNNLVISINIFNYNISLGIYNLKTKSIDYPKKWNKITDLKSKKLIEIIDSL